MARQLLDGPSGSMRGPTGSRGGSSQPEGQTRHIALVGIMWAALLVAPTPTHAADRTGAGVHGTVTLRAADGAVQAAPGVRLTLFCRTGGVSKTEVSDDRGEFRFAEVPDGVCSIAADLQGFARVTASINPETDGSTPIRLRLEVAALFSGLTATGEAPPSRRRASSTLRGRRATCRSHLSETNRCAR